MSETRLKIFTGNSNRILAEEMCRSIGEPLGEATVTSFPDGESFVKINENVRGHDVFIIQSTCPPTNHHLVELLIMIDAARRASAQRITAVLPFYGYARQDRKDQPRVPITAKLVANLLVAAGATRILTMDLHSQQIQGFFDIPVDHLFASPVFFEHLAKTKRDNLVVCSPDVGGMKMAAAYADVLGAGLALVAKKRVSATKVEAINVVGEVEGCDVLLVDDITETAGTLCAGREDPPRTRSAQHPGGSQPLYPERSRHRAPQERSHRRAHYNEFHSREYARPAHHRAQHRAVARSGHPTHQQQ